MIIIIIIIVILLIMIIIIIIVILLIMIIMIIIVITRKYNTYNKKMYLKCISSPHSKRNGTLCQKIVFNSP